jgi:hypothetical protein
MPLDAHYESFVRPLNSFDRSVLRVVGRGAQSGSQASDRLMMAGVDFKTEGFADNARQPRARVDLDRMRGQSAIGRANAMSIRRIEMLDQTTAVLDIQNLQTAADREQRQIAIECLPD